jgi:hypothetical protein
LLRSRSCLSIMLAEGNHMTPAEIRIFKVELLDEVHELASDPVADADGVKRKIEAFFTRLENHLNGKGK